MCSKMFGKTGISPVLATLLMVAVAVSMSVIIFMWSQGFLANTSEAVSSQQQAQNVGAQSLIAIESVQFTDARDDGGNLLANGDDKVIKIVVRNVGSSNVIISQVYFGISAYQMTAYPAYRAMRTNSTDTPGTDFDNKTYTYVVIGNEAQGGTPGPIWYVHKDAIVDDDELVRTTRGIPQGYNGTPQKIAAEYANIDGTNINGQGVSDVDVTQETDTAIVYAFDSDGSAVAEGVINPQGFAVIHLYLSQAWSPGKTYYIRVTTTVGTFMDVAVSATS